jgi:hypothetical protein
MIKDLKKFLKAFTIDEVNDTIIINESMIFEVDPVLPADFTRHVDEV